MSIIDQTLDSTPRQQRQMYVLYQKAVPRRKCKNCGLEQSSAEFAFDDKVADFTAKLCNTCKAKIKQPKPVRINKRGKQAASTEPPASTMWEMEQATEPSYRPHENRRIFSDAQKRLKWFEQGGLCMYCQADLSITGFHADHVHPFIKGGVNSTANLALACPRCNGGNKDQVIGLQWKPSNLLIIKRRECFDPSTGFSWQCG